MRMSIGLSLPAALLAGLVSCAVIAQTAPPGSAEAPSTGPAQTEDISKRHRQTAAELVDGGIKYLLSKRDADGGWSLGGGVAKPAVTAMVLKVLVQQPGYDTKHPAVSKGFNVLLGYRQKNGGIYNPKEGRENYTTAVALMALAAARDQKFQSVVNDAIKYLKGLQIIPGSESPDGEAIKEDDPRVGGVSYGQHGRPDLSNVGMWLEALHEAGVSGDDPHIQRALVFVTKSQNRSESNPQPWAKIGTNDGGFVYAPAVRGSAGTGESKAADPGAVGLRSYGSMTYTGFKSMLYAAVGRKDGRVQAALRWIQRYWRLDSNPNMPAVRSQQGLYYYYHVFAKALRAWGEPVISDAKGSKHNWREELIDALKARVKKDGSWEGDRRWYEADPILSTCYAVLALQEALRK